MSWVEVSEDSDFSIQNIPFGVFSAGTNAPAVGTAIGKHVLSLSVLFEEGLFNGIELPCNVFAQPTLNAFMGLTKPIWTGVRNRIISLLSVAADGDSRLKNNMDLRARALIAMSDVKMHLPATIGDYTDYYCSREHATNCGVMFRGKENALQPNWLHLPVGYHGRSSSVVVTDTLVVRPWGQVHVDKKDAKKGSSFSQCQKLDFELEIAFFVGGADNAMGTPIKMHEAEDRIFGIVILNDWSARDIQAWEYVPLGPFTAKNFCSSISPWVVTLDALEPFRCSTSAGAVQDAPVPLPYLVDPRYHESTYDVSLQVSVVPRGMSAEKTSVLSTSNIKYLYWNIKQQLVHHSITGCPMRAGDLLGSGTISGPENHMMGSLMEMSWNGTQDITLPVEKEGGAEEVKRTFLQDGDSVVMRGFGQGSGFRVGFGEVAGTINPAVENPF